MRTPEPVFLDWTGPTAESAARWLIHRTPGEQRIDLSNFLILVSSRRAGTRLRESLAQLASPRGVLSPAISTVSQWLVPQDPKIASSIESALAIAEALAGLDSQSLPNLFPRGIPFTSFDERRLFARQFMALRVALADSGHSIKSASRAFRDHADSERWQELAEIESAYFARLNRHEKIDPEFTRLNAPVATHIPGNVREVVLIATADLQPLVARKLGDLPEDISLRMLVPAPPDAKNLFDAWGRPLAEHWRERAPDWTDFDRQVRLIARPFDAAADLERLLPRDGVAAGEALEIGLLERDLLPPIREALQQSHDCIVHDPNGERLDAHWLTRLLLTLSAFLSEARFSTATDLLRTGPVAEWLRSTSGSWSLDHCLEEADAVEANHFPVILDDALRWCEDRRHLRHALQTLRHLAGQLSRQDWSKALRQWLEEVCRTFYPTLTAGERKSLATAAAALTTNLQLIESIASRYPETSCADWLKLLHASLESEFHYPDPPENAVEASGWLELQWSAAPHLVLSGFNQGAVPESFPQSPFLTRSARIALGMPTEESRATRDAYFLARLLAMRPPEKGRVDIQVLQLAADDTPRLPSALLFSGAGENLPHRVRRLFVEPRSALPEPPWQAGWKLQPPIVEMPQKMRVTGFASYLACPFEFYLRFGLGMEPFDASPSEMDARIFGTLVHHALEAFASDPEARDFADAEKISEALSDFLDTDIAANFSTPLSLPLTMQVESARRRLGAFAEVQAKARREGWRIDRVEVDFEELLGAPWQIDGWEIRGRIDRIDVHETTGHLRVLDYKTSDRGVSPTDAHLVRVTGDWPPSYAFLPDTKKRWSNLQLPLYRQLLVATGHEPERVTCGYINFPKALGSTGLALWDDFDESMSTSAWQCARAVLAAIGHKRFWPPNPRNKYPELSEWFEPSAEELVANDSPIRATLS